jgi:hypothetical protein
MAPATPVGAGWVHVRPPRQPRNPGTPTTPNPANPAKNLFPAPDDPLPLPGVQLVRPRHCAAPGAQLDPGPRGSGKDGSYQGRAT